MATNYIGPGEVINYTNTGSAISSGDVVEINGTSHGMLGVALEDIAATTGVGAVAISGVFEIVKVTGAVIGVGEAVFWDTSANNCDDDAAPKATGDFTCGTAVEAAGNGVVLVKVKLAGMPTLLT